MSKFDKIFNSEDKSEATLTLEESVAAVALVAAEANAPDTDADILESILWDSEIFAEYSEDEMSAMFQRLAGIVAQDGLGALFNTAGESIPDELVLDTFAITAAMFVADGEIPEKHKGFLQEFQQALGVEDEEAAEIIEDVIAAYSEEAEGEESDLDALLYVSPEGNFSLPIPVDEQRGGRVDEVEGSVAFSDDFGVLLKIDYFSIAGEVEAEIESIGEEAYLKYFLDNFICQAILTNVPNSRLLHAEYLEDEEAYFAVFDLPGGATISVQENGGPLTRLDAYRGIMAFIADDFCYTVSCQRIYQEGNELGSLESEAEGIMNNIFAFIETIEFSAVA
ncbi:tellurite resistance TerB family protein [Microcoleus sp. herbarium7]|uniref:tellurite resistance TerB family protein n=1 Tax=Microcoleus sp. herbarium7 TaxID=3055435 RepID=UPI002FD19D99